MSDSGPLAAPRPGAALLALLLTAGVLALPGAWWSTARAGDATLASGTVLIDAGMTATQVGDLLRERHGLRPAPLYVRLYMRLRGDGQRLRAGEYAIAAGERLARLLDRMIAGDVVRHQVTLIEGTRIDVVLARLQQEDGLVRTLTGAAGLLAAVGAQDGPAEGLFLPDTYTYVHGDRDLDVLRQSYQRMQEVLAAEWQGRAANLPYPNPYAALIAASLVEKETGHSDDRALIAGVFVERLRRGMLLQSDPTVIYALGNGFDGDLRRVDLLRDIAFNTYERAGLPPTPIALPGRAAIHAALHPREEGYLYFVARGDGSSQFSRTLEEHHIAVQRFQRPAGPPP